MKKGLLYLPLVLTFTACSSEESGNSDIPTDDSPATVQELENSGAIPKLARSTDLEGTDTVEQEQILDGRYELALEIINGGGQ